MRSARTVSKNDLTTDEIDEPLQRITDRVREAALEVMDLYIEPHPVPEGTGKKLPIRQ